LSEESTTAAAEVFRLRFLGVLEERATEKSGLFRGDKVDVKDGTSSTLSRDEHFEYRNRSADRRSEVFSNILGPALRYIQSSDILRPTLRCIQYSYVLRRALGYTQSSNVLSLCLDVRFFRAHNC
jgi:hypothetical protein